MTKQKKKKINQNVLLVAMSIFIICIVFFVVSLIRLFQKPANTVLVKHGELINYEEVVGYIIREEDLVDTSEYDGMIKTAVSDAERVSKGSVIMNYVSKAEEQLVKKIAELDIKIEKAIESQQTIFTNDVKVLDTEIENYIYANLKGSNFIDSTKQYSKEINQKVEKKAKIVGELSPAGSELKSLIEQRKKYETELNNSEKALHATNSGLVSYRVDGYENLLTPASFSELTIDYLEGLKLTTDEVISVDTDKVKIVDNFNCYIAVPLRADAAEDIFLNGTVYLRFKNTGDRLIPTTVEYFSNEEDRILVIFKTNANVEELTKYRKIGLDVVWWRSKGLKINEDMLYTTTFKVESGDSASNSVVNTSSGESIVSGDTQKEYVDVELKTVMVKKAYYNTEVYVKVLKRAKGFVIIDNYTDEELKQLGIPQENINNRGTIKLYDEIILVD
ncbi:MAG: hypothetical protein IJO08_01695 [Clostridia bacterium]|nr:hypothetical protein [Clostridia bacterium]